MSQEDDLRALAKIMDFLRREYHFSGHERVLVLLRSHQDVGREHRRGGQNPSELRPHGGVVPFHTVHETVFRPFACPVLSGYERCQG